MGARRSLRLALSVGFALMIAGSLPRPALAGCHRFTVEASPDTVTEGEAVTVTVTRDGAVSDSSIDLTVVEGTAREDRDFTARSRYTATFPDDGTSQEFTIETVDDDAVESNETFKLRLGNPQGCSVNPNYDVGPDATVTIRDDDTAAASPTATRTTAASPTTTETVTPISAPADDDGGVPIGAIIAIVVAVAAVVGLAFARLRGRAS